MPNIQQFLSDEIRRLARKEVKLMLDPLQARMSEMRKTIAELRRQIKAQEKNVREPARIDDAVPKERPVRISGERIAKLRTKLKLTQAEFADLIGVNRISVSHWELGKNIPGEAQKRKIAAVRDMGKRELKKILEEKKNVSTPDMAATEPSK